MLKKTTIVLNDLKEGFINIPILIFLMLFPFSIGNAQEVPTAPDIKISGKVTSKTTGESLPVGTVLIKGTSKGTVTDLEGNFTIEAPSNATLVFSYTGYVTQEIPVNNQTQLNVTLSEDSKVLSEVIVVGYGTMKKRDVTGAITSISQKDISNVRSANVVEAMQGKVAGVDMSRSSGRAGSGYNILVRGARSLSASNGPLYIVDGIQYTSNVDINPNDVESIEILKDASSTAIYGARGANGVIIITTKKGKTTGQSRISFNTYQGITSPNGKLPLLDRDGYIKFKNDLAWARATNKVWTNIPVQKPDGYLAELNGKELEGFNNGTNYNWRDNMLSNGYQQDYNVTMSGGSEKLVYSFSLNHFKEDGLLQQDKFKRYNVRLNLEAPMKSFLKVGTNTLVTYTLQTFQDVQGAGSSFSNPLGTAQSLSPLVTPYKDPNGNMINATAPGETEILVFYPSANAVHVNPLISNDPEYSFNEDRSAKVFSTAYADFTFLKDFSFKTSLNAELGFLRKGRFSGTFPEAGNQSAAEVNNDNTTNWQFQNILTYTKTIKEDHNIIFTGGQEALFRRSEMYMTSVRDIGLENSQWYGLSSQSGVATPSLDIPTDRFPLEIRTLESYMGRVFYNYRGKYSVQVTGRYDGASQLQEKWSFFPAASAAWNIGEESFIKEKAAVISNLKLRAGYGISGNYDVSIFSTLGRVSTNPLYYTFGLANVPANGYRPSKSGNPGLGWEKTTAVNIGLDYGFLKDRIQGSIDVYQTQTDDLLQDVLLSASSGISRVTANVGSTKNTGFELSLTSTNIRTKDFTCVTTFTFSQNKEEILSLASGRTQDLANGWFVGSPIDVFYDRKMIGIWQLTEVEEAKQYGAKPGDVKFLDIDGNPATLIDRQIIGTPRPKWTGGLNTNFSYRNLDLNIFVYARIGQTIQDRVLGTLQPDGRSNMMQLDYWTPANPSNTVPGLDLQRTNSGYSDLNAIQYTSGSFVKIRDITLGYTFPDRWISKAKIAKARIYASLKNGFIFGNFFNKNGGRLDPELNGSIGLPMNKMYALGLNFEF